MVPGREMKLEGAGRDSFYGQFSKSKDKKVKERASVNELGGTKTCL